ncbi:hypothetical protein L1987_37539 [Smallanthus sonchifolius]|uniref:Uncharacterized protein n=1 Tax=Smallanthus sonchifolius TaxID=185202 RepID=A0ACB9HHW1_9ASTR|nr:hypothetical protein L1987_37539 [Smallanthus sonchifolius]
MDTQHQTTPSGHVSRTCRRCGWPFPNPHPSSKHRRTHNRICGTIEGYTNLIDIHSDAVSDDDHHSDSDDQETEKTPSPNIEKRIIKESGSSAGGIEERSNRSEDDRFSDAVTEFSDTGISPRVISEVRFEEHSIPLVKDTDGSHKDKIIDQMELSDNKDQGEDVYTLSVPNDIPLVDKAETLIEDFKDHKTMYSNVSRADKQTDMLDIFEVKTVQQNVHESQTSDSAFVPTVVIEESKVAKTRPLEISKTVPESADNLSEAEASRDKHLVETLGQRMPAEIKAAEVDHSVVSDSKDSVKVGTSETVVNEGGGKLLTGQDCGVDASFDSSSRNSLEGNWGSVSEVSDVFGKSEISDDRSRVGRSDAFEGASLVESEQENIEQSASEIKEVKVQKSQPSKSEAIAKVTNWSTSGHIATAPLRKLISEAPSSNPKPLPNMIKKDEEASKPGKSTLTQSPKVNQETSSVENSGEGKNDKKSKGIAWWVKFMCCSMPIKR